MGTREKRICAVGRRLGLFALVFAAASFAHVAFAAAPAFACSETVIANGTTGQCVTSFQEDCPPANTTFAAYNASYISAQATQSPTEQLRASPNDIPNPCPNSTFQIVTKVFPYTNSTFPDGQPNQGPAEGKRTYFVEYQIAGGASATGCSGCETFTDTVNWPNTCTMGGETCPLPRATCSGGSTCSGQGASCSGAGTTCTDPSATCTNGASCPSSGGGGGSGGGTGGGTSGGIGGVPDFVIRIISTPTVVGNEVSSQGEFGLPGVGVLGHFKFYSVVPVRFTLANDGSAAGTATWSLSASQLAFSGGFDVVYGGDPFFSEGGCPVSAPPGSDPNAPVGPEPVSLNAGESRTFNCTLAFSGPPQVGTLFLSGEVTPFDTDPASDHDTASDNQTAPARIAVIAGPRSTIAPIPSVFGGSAPPEFHGTAAPVGAAEVATAGAAATDRRAAITKVEIALVRIKSGAKAARNTPRCLWLNHHGRFSAHSAARGVCQPASGIWLRATGTKRWRYRLAHRLPRASYVLYTRSTDRAGVTETAFTNRLGNRRAFRAR